MSGRPRAEFVVDVGAAVGGGHLARCAALAELLGGFGWQTLLRTDEESAGILPRSANAFSSWSRGTDPQGYCELAVFDGYKFDANIERRWRSFAGRRVVVDDLANRHHEVEFLFDPTPGRKRADYASLVPSDAMVSTGMEYAMLRPGWRLQRFRSGSNNCNEVRTVIVAMGATDPCDATSAILAAVVAALPAATVCAILGRGAPHLSAVQGRFSGVAQVLVDPDDYDERIAAADLVIGAAGSSAYERACVGVPSITCVTAPNQVEVSAGLARLDVFELLDEPIWRNPDALGRRICALATDSDRRRQLSRSGREAIDGRGALRVAVKTVGSDGSGISLRLFEREDEDWLLALQRIPETRRFARRPDPPTAAEHSNFVEDILASDRRMLFVLEETHHPVGYVRLDRMSGDAVEVSIAVHPDRQGTGVGSAALGLVRGLVPGLRLKAFVSAENHVSTALFKKRGYSLVGTGEGGVWLESAPQ